MNREDSRAYLVLCFEGCDGKESMARAHSRSRGTSYLRGCLVHRLVKRSSLLSNATCNTNACAPQHSHDAFAKSRA